MTPSSQTNGKHDVWSHRMVILAIGIVAIGTPIAMTCLAVNHAEIPASMPLIGCTALGALASMLVNIMKGNDP